MKVIKTIKNLKFWSKKKKKKKINNNNVNHNSQTQCSCHHNHDGYQSFQPSAPPLPLWLDYEEQTYTQHLLASDLNLNISPRLPISYQAQNLQEDDDTSNAAVDTDVVVNTALASGSGDVDQIGCSYQQYMVEKPVYEVPVLRSREVERSAGYVGCVFNVGAHLFRCFFPCFRIRDI
ncbi:hypothetical protein CTI12_AA312410 [Artemisia annua]|uniref:Uncharacterized protein n=1 Tax=Artemisia annua TaxID=35608 RepID=A0A2U1N3M4_ARTAN|nr:hypothetical protein CTI12_AA312410 [Artemisia annua]